MSEIIGNLLSLTSRRTFDLTAFCSAVPHLLWETRILVVENGRLGLSMDDLKQNFEPINIQVALTCDGNRRKGLWRYQLYLLEGSTPTLCSLGCVI